MVQQSWRAQTRNTRTVARPPPAFLDPDPSRVHDRRLDLRTPASRPRRHRRSGGRHVTCHSGSCRPRVRRVDVRSEFQRPSPPSDDRLSLATAAVAAERRRRELVRLGDCPVLPRAENASQRRRSRHAARGPTPSDGSTVPRARPRTRGQRTVRHWAATRRCASSLRRRREERGRRGGLGACDERVRRRRGPLASTSAASSSSASTAPRSFRLGVGAYRSDAAHLQRLPIRLRCVARSARRDSTSLRPRASCRGRGARHRDGAAKNGAPQAARGMPTADRSLTRGDVRRPHPPPANPTLTYPRRPRLRPKPAPPPTRTTPPSTPRRPSALSSAPSQSATSPLTRQRTSRRRPRASRAPL